MKKRILSVLVAVVLVVSVVVITSSAANYMSIQTPHIVYGTAYTAETIETGKLSGSNTTLPVAVTSNIQVSEVGADYIVFSQIAENSADVLIKLVGSTISYAKVVEGVASEYTFVPQLTTDDIVYELPAEKEGEDPITYEFGCFKLTGLEEGATYSIKVKSGTLTRVGGSHNYMAFSESSAIEVALKSYTPNGKWPAPTGLDVKDGKFTGTESGKTYEYVKLSAPEFAIVEENYVEYNAETTTLEAGLYAVRVMPGTQGDYSYETSPVAYILSKGDNVGTIALDSATAADFVSGKWTFFTPEGKKLQPTVKIETNNNNAPTFSWNIYLSYQEIYNAGALAYEFTNDEIISVKDFFGIEFIKTHTNGDHVRAIDGSDAEVKGMAIFHIFGGDKATVEVPFTRRTSANNNIKIDFATAAAAQLGSMNGYVYRMEIDMIYLEDGQTLADVGLRAATGNDGLANNANGYYSYQIYKFQNPNISGRIKLSARAAEQTPVLRAEGTDTDGVYRIYGLDSAKSYEWSSNGTAFTTVPAGSTYIEVTRPGTYYVRALATDTSYESAVASIKISGAMPAIPEGALTYDAQNKKIVGLGNLPSGEYSLNYDWCRVSLDGTLAWNKTAKSSDGSVSVEPGYYAFRYSALEGNGLNYVAGAPTYISTYELDGDSDNKGSVSVKVSPESNNFTAGLWTASGNGVATGQYAYIFDNGKRIAYRYVPSFDNITTLAWQYQLAEDEMFDLKELATLKFTIGYENGNPFNSDINGYVRIYVINGEENFYEIPFVAENKSLVTLNVCSLWEDEVEADSDFLPSGNVIAFEIRYFSEETSAGLEIIDGKVNYACLSLGALDANSRTSDFIKLKKVVDVDSVRTYDAIGTYGGEIVGLNPEAVYQIADYDEASKTVTSEWRILPMGSTARCDDGSYVIRSFAVATDTQFLPSNIKPIKIDPAPQGDERIPAKIDKIILPEEVEISDADYIFNIDESHWINRVAISNIKVTSPKSTIVFESKDYRITVAVSDIDLTLDTSHYFDMKVTFDGESKYDRMYSKMKEIADEKELVKGIHFESSTGFFFENARFEVYLGEKYEGYEVELRSLNERVKRLRNEEEVTVEDGWASFTKFGKDYLILCPALAEEQE